MAEPSVCKECERPFATTAHQEMEPAWCNGTGGGDCLYRTAQRLRGQLAATKAAVERAKAALFHNSTPDAVVRRLIAELESVK